MAAKKTLLFLVTSTATAQITTSFWMPDVKSVYGTDNLRYVASVVGAEGDRLTLACHLANDMNYEGLGLGDISYEQTFTFASTMFEASTSNVVGDPEMTSDAGYSVKCDMQTADTVAQCTVSQGQYQKDLLCRTRTGTRSFTHVVSTRLWTFSNSDTSGVETIVRSWGAASGTPPAICTESSLVLTHTASRAGFATYQFVITAGEEKISATTGAVATISSAEPTGTQATSGGTNSASSPTASSTASSTAAPEQATGAAAPVKTMVPIIAGLGAAVAVLL